MNTSLTDHFQKFTHVRHSFDLLVRIKASYSCKKLMLIIAWFHGRPQKKMQGGQKHSRDGHLGESYSQVSVSDRVTN